jgi:hypothetical protein
VVQTGAEHRKSGLAGALLEDRRSAGDRIQDRVEAKHDGIADRLDQLIIGAERGRRRSFEPVDQRHSLPVAMSIGQRRESGQVHESEG